DHELLHGSISADESLGWITIESLSDSLPGGRSGRPFAHDALICYGGNSGTGLDEALAWTAHHVRRSLRGTGFSCRGSGTIDSVDCLDCVARSWPVRSDRLASPRRVPPLLRSILSCRYPFWRAR